MANTYYDSQLTAAEIEAALEAIDGVIVPANNGKVLAINNGKFEARSVQWGGGSSVIQPLSVTANGTYNAPSGVDGYSPVTVNVPSSGELILDDYAVKYTPTHTASTVLSGGFYFTVNSFIQLAVSKIRVWPLEETVNVYLSDSNGNTIASVVNAEVIPDQWNDIPLPNLVILNGGSSYVVWHSNPTVKCRYHFSIPTISNKVISNVTGRYGTIRDSFPLGTESNMYAVDIFIHSITLQADS